MKKFSLTVFILAILFSSCRQNKTVDTTILPEPTQTGAGTFGCLVDGYIYVGGRYEDIIHGTGKSIIFKYDTAAKAMNVVVKVKNEDKSYIKFTIDGLDRNANSQTCNFINSRFGQYSDDNKGDSKLDSIGVVNITRLDYYRRIISGTFYGTIIKEGRFDVIFE